MKDSVDDSHEATRLKERVAELEAEIHRIDNLLRPLCGHTRWHEFSEADVSGLYESADGHYVRCAVNYVLESTYFKSGYKPGYDRSYLVNPVLNRTPAP